MIAHALIFYLLSSITILSSIMVISSKNTVHSVFFLILAFVNVSCLFIMIGAEFVGMILLIVYVGAVAVLFLFVVMMLEGNFIKIINSYFDILTTFHPAFLLRQPARKKSTLEDLYEFKRKLSG